jgi:hypothetical protein
MNSKSIFSELRILRRGGEETVEMADLGLAIADLLRTYMREANLSPRDMAKARSLSGGLTTLSEREIKTLLRTNKCDSGVLSRLVAMTGLSLGQLLMFHPEYAERKEVVVSRKERVLRMIGSLASEADLVRGLALLRIVTASPSIKDYAVTAADAFLGVAKRMGLSSPDVEDDDGKSNSESKVFDIHSAVKALNGD